MKMLSLMTVFCLTVGEAKKSWKERELQNFGLLGLCEPVRFYESIAVMQEAGDAVLSRSVQKVLLAY